MSFLSTSCYLSWNIFSEQHTNSLVTYGHWTAPKQRVNINIRMQCTLGVIGKKLGGTRSDLLQRYFANEEPWFYFSSPDTTRETLARRQDRACPSITPFPTENNLIIIKREASNAGSLALPLYLSLVHDAEVEDLCFTFAARPSLSFCFYYLTDSNIRMS